MIYILYNAGIEDDAVRIFNKYLAKDALDPIGVDDVCRNECISK